jgi:hypothetical protein
MILFGASDWAYVGGAIAVPLVSGVFGVIIWKLNGVYREVRSPNGASTGALNYDAWKTSMELREQMAELREAQFDHRTRYASDANNAREAHGRLEKKVDLIAGAQRKYEVRFQHLFNHLELDDPVEGGE